MYVYMYIYIYTSIYHIYIYTYIYIHIHTWAWFLLENIAALRIDTFGVCTVVQGLGDLGWLPPAALRSAGTHCATGPSWRPRVSGASAGSVMCPAHPKDGNFVHLFLALFWSEPEFRHSDTRLEKHVSKSIIVMVIFY